MFTMGLGQGIALSGALISWSALADAYCVSRYFIFSALCLAFAITGTPKRGLLTIPGLVYFGLLSLTALLAFKWVCFVGVRLNFFGAVFPMALVGVCYSYSIGERWEKTANAYILGCVIVALMCLGQTKGLFSPQGDYFSGRVYACIGSPVFLSGVMAVAVTLCLGGLWTPFAIPLFLCVILLTQSRAGLVAAAAGCLGYAYARGIISIKEALGLCLAAALISVSLFSSLRNTSKSDQGRYQMARMAVKAVADHPFGVGPERFTWVIDTYRDKEFNAALGPTWSNAYVHNSLLEALLTGGPLFLIVHIGFALSIALFLYRANNPCVFGAAMALGAFSLCQPCPLQLKCLLACLAGSVDPSHRPISRAPFVIASSLALAASLVCLTGAKIWADGLQYGMADLIVYAQSFVPENK